MKLVPYLISILLVGLGAFVVYLGEQDDSPGLGGIGLIIMVVAAIIAIRQMRK
ncbi:MULTISPECIES: hypothetical protein [unclassified Corynebacterium]|uniref:hypothetical protein n=1 Tax=unclassified Corynebacterium TaxID=2624378 RepID=UPI00309E8CC4